MPPGGTVEAVEEAVAVVGVELLEAVAVEAVLEEAEAVSGVAGVALAAAALEVVPVVGVVAAGVVEAVALEVVAGLVGVVVEVAGVVEELDADELDASAAGVVVVLALALGDAGAGSGAAAGVVVLPESGLEGTTGVTGVGVGVGFGGGGGGRPGTESSRAQVLVMAAELSIWLLCCAEIALCMPMPSVSAITAPSIACVCEAAALMLKRWARRTASLIWLLVNMAGGEREGDFRPWCCRRARTPRARGGPWHGAAGARGRSAR